MDLTSIRPSIRSWFDYWFDLDSTISSINETWISSFFDLMFDPILKTLSYEIF